MVLDEHALYVGVDGSRDFAFAHARYLANRRRRSEFVTADKLENDIASLVGVAVSVGMLGVTLFGLVLTPVFYVVIRKLVTRFAGKDTQAPLTTDALPLTSANG